MFAETLIPGDAGILPADPLSITHKGNLEATVVIVIGALARFHG